MWCVHEDDGSITTYINRKHLKCFCFDGGIVKAPEEEKQVIDYDKIAKAIKEALKDDNKHKDTDN